MVHLADPTGASGATVPEKVPVWRTLAAPEVCDTVVLFSSGLASFPLLSRSVLWMMLQKEIQN